VKRPRLYSTPAFAVCSIFGGPLSALSFAAIQSRAMGRFRRDLPALLLGLAVVLAGSAWSASAGLLRQALVDLGTTHVPVLLHIAYRLIAVAFFLVYWRMLLPERRRLLQSGLEPEPGYGAGVAALLIGLVGGTLLLLALRG
jgi:hypothetical protein